MKYGAERQSCIFSLPMEAETTDLIKDSITVLTIVRGEAEKVQLRPPEVQQVGFDLIIP